MANTMFRIDPFGSVAHNEETLKMAGKMKSWGGWSSFVRIAIVKYAEDFDFDFLVNLKEYTVKPDYLNDEQWQVFRTLVKSSKSVDYTYFLAFFWLKSLPEFRYINQSDLLRKIISESGHFFPLEVSP